MKTKKKPKEKFKKLSMMEAAHQMAKGLYEVGIIGEKEMRYFDEKCLPAKKSSRAKK